MQPIAVLTAMLLALVLTSCREGDDGSGPGPIPYPKVAEELAVTRDAQCEEFVAAHKPAKTFRFTAEAVLPTGFQPDSGDYLILNLFGYLENSADDPACVYHAAKIRVDSADMNEAGTAVAFTVIARLDDRLKNYFTLEGFSAKQEAPEYGAFRIDAPPMAFDPKRSQYRFEGLEVADANIRVRNATGLRIDSVQVGEHVYGPIGIDGTSGYRPFFLAYQYDYIRLHSGKTDLVIQPIDFLGEEPIGNGFFTYELYFSGPGKEHLAIRFSRD